MAMRIITCVVAIFIVPTLQDSTAQQQVPMMVEQMPANMVTLAPGMQMPTNMVPVMQVPAGMQAAPNMVPVGMPADPHAAEITTTEAPITTTDVETTTAEAPPTTTLAEIGEVRLGSAILDFYNTSFFTPEEVKAVMTGHWASVASMVEGCDWSSEWASLLKNMKCTHYRREFKGLKVECDDNYKEAEEVKKAGFVLGRVSSHCDSKKGGGGQTWKKKFCGKREGGLCGEMDEVLSQIERLEHALTAHVKSIYYLGNEKGWFESISPNKAADFENLRELLASAGLGTHFLQTHMAIKEDAEHHVVLSELFTYCKTIYQSVKSMKTALTAKYTPLCVSNEEQKWEMIVESGTMHSPSISNAGLIAGVILALAGSIFLALRAFRHTVVSTYEAPVDDQLLELEPNA